MQIIPPHHWPRFLVFEGVDGVGKTTLVRTLELYYRLYASDLPLYVGSFPGSEPGSLGEWVYRFHHSQARDAPLPEQVAGPALQLLHVAAHLDAILTFIGPTLTRGGVVLLDRYWWSTYSYARRDLPPELAWSLVYPEQRFLASFPSPIIVYVSRSQSLKSHEINAAQHAELARYYREVIVAQQQAGVIVHELENSGSLEAAWANLLSLLGLPYYSL